MRDKRDIQIIKDDDLLDLTGTSKSRFAGMQRKENNSIKNRYDKLKGSTSRDAFVERARTFSTYTTPNMYPTTSTNNQGTGTNTTGWQSFGSDCVNNLTNKMVLTLFPPHVPFANIELTEELNNVLAPTDVKYVKEAGILTNATNRAMQEHEAIAGRVALAQALEHLLVGGNTCLYVPSEGNMVNYPLDRYVARFDKSNTLLELILEESKGIDTFEEPLASHIKKLVREKRQIHNKSDEVELYTRVYLVDGFYKITQEVLGEIVGQSYRVRKDRNPFIVLRWKVNYGEHYGRSYVEQYASDFHMVQFLSEALGKGMILMADIKYFVKQGSPIDMDHLLNSDVGEVLYGSLDDIGVLQLEKYADFTPIVNVLDRYEKRLGQAFMQTTSVQRNAERVTAYEIRRDSIEIEKRLGQAYTLLGLTLQQPYFILLLDRIEFKYSNKHFKINIVTGVSALSKMSDSDKLMQFTEMLQLPNSFPPQVQGRVKWGEFATEIANQLSLKVSWLMTDEEFNKAQAASQEQQQQGAEQEAMVKASPTIAKSLLDNQGG